MAIVKKKEEVKPAPVVSPTTVKEEPIEKAEPTVILRLSKTGRIKADGIEFLNGAAGLASGGRCLNWMQQVQIAAKRGRARDILARKYNAKKEK